MNFFQGGKGHGRIPGRSTTSSTENFGRPFSSRYTFELLSRLSCLTLRAVRDIFYRQSGAASPIFREICKAPQRGRFGLVVRKG